MNTTAISYLLVTLKHTGFSGWPEFCRLLSASQHSPCVLQAKMVLGTPNLKVQSQQMKPEISALEDWHPPPPSLKYMEKIH